MHRIVSHLIDISIMYSIANQMLSFFAPLKVSESFMFVLFKNFCYSYLRGNDFSLKLPHFELIRNSAFVFQAD